MEPILMTTELRQDIDRRADDWINDEADVADIEEVHPECPYCGGEPFVLGILGRLLHLRCRFCGLNFSREVS